VQSLRASRNGRNVATAAGVLHAANRGSNAGVTWRAIQTNMAIRAFDSGLNRWFTAASAPAQNIACKTLPYVFARMGLPPQYGMHAMFLFGAAYCTP
jgi:hypothetical protein